MFYEFYIDQFFLEHFLTGFLLIAAVTLIQRNRMAWGRIVTASAVNAAVVTLLVLARRSGWYLTGLFFASLILYAGYGVGAWVRGTFFLLIVTVCFGGTLELLMNLSGLPLMAGSAAAFGLLGAIGRILSKRKTLQAGLATVRLQWEKRTEIICGMIDTGNHLEEPLTGRPVSIVEASLAERLLGDHWETRRGLYLIPYHSIGTEKGWMRGVTIDRMTVELPGGRVVVTRPVLAIYEGQVSAGKEYQMILHPLHARPDAGCGPTKAGCGLAEAGRNPGEEGCARAEAGCSPAKESCGPTKAGYGRAEAGRNPGETGCSSGDVGCGRAEEGCGSSEAGIRTETVPADIRKKSDLPGMTEATDKQDKRGERENDS